MPSLRTVKEGDAAAVLSSAVLFKILWDELADLLGSATTAVLLRRAVRRARIGCRELDELTISRTDDQFQYVVPPCFVQARGPSAALHSLLGELRPLLVEMTGQIAIRRLEEVPELRGWGPAPLPAS